MTQRMGPGAQAAGPGPKSGAANREKRDRILNTLNKLNDRDTQKTYAELLLELLCVGQLLLVNARHAWLTLHGAISFFAGHGMDGCRRTPHRGPQPMHNGCRPKSLCSQGILHADFRRC